MKKYIYACIRLPMEIGDDGQCRPLNDRGKLFFEPCYELPPINTEPSPTLDDIMKSFHTSEIVFKDNISDNDENLEQDLINTDTESHGNTDTDSHGNTDTESHGNTDTESHGNTDTETHENTDIETHGNTDTENRIFRYEITGSRAPQNGTNTYKRRHRLVHRYSVKKQYR